MKNHQSYPTNSKPFPEVNGIFVRKKNQWYRYEKKEMKREKR